jgi:uncharacterized protein HemX
VHPVLTSAAWPAALFEWSAPAVFAATQIEVGTIVGVVVALVTGAAGVYGWQAKAKDKAAEVWKNIAEAREVENRMQAQELAQLKARLDVITQEWIHELVRQTIITVEKHMTEGEAKRHEP